MDPVERYHRTDAITERTDSTVVVVHFATGSPQKKALFRRYLQGTEFLGFPSVTRPPHLDERMFNSITATPHIIAAVKAGWNDGNYKTLLSRAVMAPADSVFKGRVRLITLATDVMLLTPDRDRQHPYPVYLGHNKPPEDAGKKEIETYLLTHFAGDHTDDSLMIREAGFRVGGACCVTDLVRDGDGFIPLKRRGLAGFIDVPFTFWPFSTKEIADYVAKTEVEKLRETSAGCRWESRDFWKHLHSVDGILQHCGPDRELFLVSAKGGFPQLPELIAEAVRFSEGNATGALTDQVQIIRRQLNGFLPQELELGDWGSFSGSRDVFQI